MTRRLPDFLVIGAPRAGTTALYRHLDAHPQVVMADPKEPHYFCFAGQQLDFRGPGDDRLNAEWLTDLDAYAGLFAGVDPATRAGEASTAYLWCPDAPQRVRDTLGTDVQLVALLRDPVERAWSTFHYLRREGLEPCDDLLAAVGRETERAASGWSPIWRYTELGRYGEQLERWLAVFGTAQLRVYRYDDLDRRPAWLLDDLLGFLDVERGHDVAVDVRHNVSGTIRSPALHRALTGDHVVRRVAKRLAPRRLRDLARRAVAANVRPAEQLDAGTREQLAGRFDDDISRLESLLGWDLSAWRA